MLHVGGDQGSFELHMDTLKLTKEVCELRMHNLYGWTLESLIISVANSTGTYFAVLSAWQTR